MFSTWCYQASRALLANEATVNLIVVLTLDVVQWVPSPLKESGAMLFGGSLGAKSS